MGINIKTHTEHLPYLNIKLIKFFLAKDIKNTLLGELFDGLNDKRACFPRIARTLTDATALRQDVNDFT